MNPFHHRQTYSYGNIIAFNDGIIEDVFKALPQTLQSVPHLAAFDIITLGGGEITPKLRDVVIMSDNDWQTSIPIKVSTTYQWCIGHKEPLDALLN